MSKYFLGLGVVIGFLFSNIDVTDALCCPSEQSRLFDPIKTEKGKNANKFTLYPDWIIEILSPEKSANKVIKKILFCLKQGTKLGRLIDGEDESVMIFKPDQLLEIKSEEDILPVLEAIQDWQLSVAGMFNWLRVDEEIMI